MDATLGLGEYGAVGAALNVRTEGIEGLVASVKGLDLSPEGIVMKNDIHLRRFEQI